MAIFPTELNAEDLSHLHHTGKAHGDASVQWHENMLSHAIDEDNQEDHRILRRYDAQAKHSNCG
jgi:hypothetical protein